MGEMVAPYANQMNVYDFCCFFAARFRFASLSCLLAFSRLLISSKRMRSRTICSRDFISLSLVKTRFFASNLALCRSHLLFGYFFLSFGLSE